MATDKSFHEIFLNKINSSKIKTRSMMGEYLVYYEGGLYDNRLLVKASNSSLEKLEGYELVSPYPNAKEMIFIPNINDIEDIETLFSDIKNDLR
ncbi:MULTISPECIES: transcriptional regulator [Staphylococcus]|uniref:transcriptional regulator n=1 Tax=Staphylococcus TaxID=1279 RepID=UPI00069F99D9|nr:MULTISPECIES: transcriptional regulator [Staphylococcus]MCE0453928.1 transcriptional regulator [Staphylococcus haemolyticus]OFS54235.1 transcriptional regulator [Staphylococcus sp. HMSC065C09]OFV30476.1 transcriptional regulator [Staphylococcus sp. HMSC14D10]OHQ11857.1 transcriptional regulator [Staphylococcus sp. HMSC064E03]OLF65591.1 transcriptional regulator [Staphylococcus sp. MB377]